MKQGRATTSIVGSTKQEPISHAVNPAGAAQIGLAEGRMAAIAPLYEGRGLQAPHSANTTHPCGSQGKHK